MDYRLDAFNEQEQPKKYLKNKSPMKNKVFREDEDDNVNENNENFE